MTDQTPVDPTPAAPAVPENPAAKLQEFLGKLMGDMGRLRSQTDYFARHTTEQLNALGERIDHLTRCVQMLFDGMHLEMPQPMPRLLDASVELVAEDALPTDEVCELRIGYRVEPHPLHGHYEVLIGGSLDAQATSLERLHPIVQQRIVEAFDNLRATGPFKYGSFYFVRLSLVHARPINETSVQFSKDTPAANDEAPPTPEPSHESAE